MTRKYTKEYTGHYQEDSKGRLRSLGKSGTARIMKNSDGNSKSKALNKLKK